MRAGRRVQGAAGVVVLGLLVAAGPLEGQSLAERAQVRDGQVRLSYATRPEVCGSGRNIHVSRSTDDWESDCEHGPARVALTWSDGALVDVDTYVAGRWRAGAADVVDLGTVSAADAAAVLLDLAERVPGKAGEHLIFPAAIADSVEVWPRLITLARNERVASDTRKSAVFWLGQAAGERAVADLGELAADESGDREVQESAVFALSQLRDGAGVPSLLDVARTHPDVRIRKSAMFWLGQTNDPRAVALFEEILRR